MDPSLSSPRRRAAFTLLELLIVISIIAVLASLLIPAVIKVIDRAKKAQTKVLITGLRGALTMYEQDHQKLPTTAPGALMSDEDQLTCLYAHLNDDRSDGYGTSAAYFSFEPDQVIGRGAEGDPGLPAGAIIDGWGHGIRYQEYRSIPTASRPPGARNPKSYDLTSPAGDGELGTPDDCGN